MSNDTNRDEKRGVLFSVEEKKSENSPDYTGSITLNGVKYSLSAWGKVSSAGKPYLSLSIREWQERGEGRSAEAAPKPAGKKAPPRDPFA
jgi:uncharacterized protein (DUF736 family)